MEFIGEYHRDKVLTLPENQRKQMDLPTWRNDVEVVNELFGWVLKRGKEKIECRSEEEAQYIYALWSFDWNDFWVPTDDKYLSEILPRLLKLKKGHDEVLEEKGSLYSRKSIRDEFRRRFHLMTTLRDEEEDVEGDDDDNVLSEGTVAEEEN